MGHAVHYQDAAGGAHLEDLEGLEEALQRVERLRNEEGATHVRVFREVPIEVRTYYRVVVAGDGQADGAGATSEVIGSAELPGAAVMSPPTGRPAAVGEDAEPGPGPRRSRFARS